MPFDVLQTDPQMRIDPLAALGIVPVPDEVMFKHMEVMLIFVRVQRQRHRDDWRKFELKREYLEWQLKHVSRLPIVGKHLPWRAAAPRSVRRLALQVRDAIPDAEFTLGYIQNDPYLVVNYLDENYHRRTACLGIWFTRFHTVAIARQTGAPR